MASDFNIYNYLSNLSYINKDFNSIWEEIIDFVPKLTNKWKPGEANESDPLVVLLKELGILGDKLNYNIDKNTLEQFPDLLTQLRTAYSVFKSMGYNPNWYRSATTNISIIYNGANSEKATDETETGDFTINRFTQVCSDDKTQIYTLLEDAKFTIGNQSIQNVLAIEGTCNDFDINGNTLISVSNLDSQNRLYFLQPNIAQNGIFISSDDTFKEITIENLNTTPVNKTTTTETTNSNINLGGETINVWTRVDNIYQYLPNDKVFKFGIDPTNGSAYIQFPDTAGTLMGNGVYIKYILSSGSQGNITSNTISSFVNEPKFDNYTFSEDNFTLNNTITTQNGKDPETIEEMQKNYERIVGTFNTLVTLRDYENYIYNAENNVGQHVVSNIRLGDRSNDLYRSYKYITQTQSGTFIRKTSVLPLDKGIDELKAWDITLYPLQARDNISTYEDYSATFDRLKNTNLVEDSIEEAKSLNHDIHKVTQLPIIVDYDIKGQIYLQRTLSRSEAEEVENNVYSAIYRNFNAREVNWGEPINYQKLVDVIKNADSRIQYVAINPLEYFCDWVKYKETIETINNENQGENLQNIDVTKRAILAGVTPWTKYSDYKYYYYNSSEGASVTVYGGNDNKIVKIIPKTTFSGKGESETTVRANETLSILVPGYRTDTTYGNYFYALYKGTKPISVNTPHTLVSGENIYIFETRKDADDARNEDLPTTASYTIKEGETVTISGNDSQLKDKNEYVLPTNTVINMGSKITISTIVPDENQVINPRATDPNKDKISTDPNHNIKILTNSEKLIEALSHSTDDPLKPPTFPVEYTLNIGEYVLYANNNNDENITLELGIIGEGNTLTFSSKPTSPAEPESYKDSGLLKASLDNISNGQTNTNELNGIIINSGSLSYRVNTIYNFGENYSLTLAGGNWPTKDDTTIVNKLDKNVTSISYSLDGETGELPHLKNGDSYLYSYQLALTIAPGNDQILYTGQEVELDYKDGKSDPIEGDNNTRLQSNIAIIYSGGAGLSVGESDTLQKDLNILVSKGVISDYNNSTSYFTELGETKTIILKGGDNIAGFIVPALDGDGNVIYLAFNNPVECNLSEVGGNDTIKGTSAIGPIYAVEKIGETGMYYKDDSTEPSNGTIYNTAIPFDTTNFKTIESGKPEKIYTSCVQLKAELYTSDFTPVYEPSDNELISNPNLVDSYFNPNHPLNRYVIPRLYNEENTTQLKELKVSNLSIRG